MCNVSNCNKTNHSNYNKVNIDSPSLKNLEIWENTKGPIDDDSFIATCDKVFESNQPNYTGCRIPVPSNINVVYLEQSLCDYEDCEIVNFLKFGWPINYERKTMPTASKVNHKGATEFEQVIDNYLKREIECGATLGPFKTNPFKAEVFTSPLNSVPKKDSSERRVILDLSFPHGQAVNDGIPKGEYLGENYELSYPSVDDLAKQIRTHGEGCMVYKRDLKRAFRQIPIDPGDLHFLGYFWKNNLFIDKNAPMGLRTSAMMCQRITSAIVHIHKQLGYSSINYVDDLAGAAPSPIADDAFQKLGKVIENAGFVESKEKACSPATSMTFLGVEFDTLKMECRVPSLRLSETKTLIATWLSKKYASKVQLQSLIGCLQFVGKCVRNARIFIGRMLATLGKLKRQKDKFKINNEFRKDLLWWDRFLEHYNGVSIIPDIYWSRPDKVLATDSCLTGCGGICGNEYFHATFPEFIKLQNMCINELEMLTVTVAIKLWAHKLAGKRLLINCDNEVTVTAINSGKVKDKILLDNLHEQRYICAVYECEIKAVHIAGVVNRLPDALSRWHLSSNYAKLFYEQTVDKNMKCIPIDDSLFKLTCNC